MPSRAVALMAFSLAALLAAAGLAGAQAGDPTEAPRWLETSYELEIGENLRAVTLEGRVDVHETETPDDARLRQLCGDSCAADELREAYRRADESGKRELRQGIETKVEDRVEAALANMAGGGAQPTSNATVSEASLSAEPSGPAFRPSIPVNVTGSVELQVLQDAGYSLEQVDALFRMGARVPQAIQQDVQAGSNLTLEISATEPAAFVDAGEGTVGEDPRAVTWNETNWQGTQPAAIDDEVLLGDPDVVVPNASEIDVDVTVDVAEVDANYGGLLGAGRPADADVNISVDGRFDAVEVPREIDRVQLEYLSADAIRIGLDHGLIGNQLLASFEDRARQQVVSSFRDTFGAEPDVAGGFTPGSLAVDRVGSPPGTGAPVRLAMSGNAEVAFPPEQTPSEGARAFTVSTVSIGDLALPNLETPTGAPPDVILLLPDGVALSYDGVQGGTVEESTVDGRNAYTFSPTGDSGAMTIQGAEMALNHPFVWDLFWPLLLFLFLLLLVGPGVAILLVTRERRRREDERVAASGPPPDPARPRTDQGPGQGGTG